ncbi:MAG TPA: glycosyltransferase [Dehalococcoidia bacterium]|nr:glycosyltransferase [Dehalococcoidia bacterium]
MTDTTGTLPLHLSAVLCTRNRPDLVGTALRSVLNNEYPSFDLVVVDQSDDDGTAAIVRRLQTQYLNLRYIHTKRVGLSAAYNTGIASSSGEIIAFTDDDCKAPIDWLAQIERAFAHNPDISLLYGQVLAPNELRTVPGVVPEWKIARRRRVSKQSRLASYGMGANFAARRRLFAAIGGFDEALGGGGPLRSSQDFDLQYRASLAGFATLLEPSVHVDHYGHRTSQEWPKTLTAYGVGNGAFYMKHIRCGDPAAAWMLGKDLGRELARCAIKPLLQRPHSRAYLAGMLQGMRQSLAYPIERARRTYVITTPR